MTDLSVDAPILASRPSPALGINVIVSVTATALLLAGALALAELVSRRQGALYLLGGALGVYLGGLLYEKNGSYDVIWWSGVFFGIASALINLPIVEKPVARSVAAAA